MIPCIPGLVLQMIPVVLVIPNCTNIICRKNKPALKCRIMTVKLSLVKLDIVKYSKCLV